MCLIYHLSYSFLLCHLLIIFLGFAPSTSYIWILSRMIIGSSNGSNSNWSNVYFGSNRFKCLFVLSLTQPDLEYSIPLLFKLYLGLFNGIRRIFGYERSMSSFLLTKSTFWLKNRLYGWTRRPSLRTAFDVQVV